MSDHDQDQKTESPSEKKLHEAHERGEFARSAELGVVLALAAALPAHVDADDLYSVGVTGLIAAVRRYQPEQSHTFAAYATTRIRGAVLDELRRLDWFPRRARAKARKIKTAIGDLEQRLGRAPTEEETRAELGLTPKDYAHWLGEVRPITFVAIDDTAESDEGGGGSLRRPCQHRPPHPHALCRGGKADRARHRLR
jgi:RNA polymerase sigma factor (sigma-70 family)